MERALQIFFSNRWYYHTTFWVLYNGFWLVLFSDGTFTIDGLAISAFYALTHISGAYLNIYWLIPRFLDKKRYWPYSFLLLLNCLFFSVLLGFLMVSYIEWLQPGEGWRLLNEDSRFLGSVLGSTFSTILLVMVIKFSRQRIRIRNRAQLLEKERLQTELKFLKSQLNPHFLFNAINNIYVLIRKDPEEAAEALAKFSEILRYQLYECNDEKISLNQELQSLNSYIALSSLSKNRVDVNVDITQQVNGELIAPILLIPLVENAFKHVSDFKDRSNWIDIRLQLEDGQLQFDISNSKKEDTVDQPPISSGGIGLENIRRRLELTYPQNYDLKLQETEESYRVSLTLPIEHL